MKMIIDTDIGDDWDDIFTLAVAVGSPEIELLGATTVGGDAALRARLTRRFLDLAGRGEVPVAVGSTRPVKAVFSHRRWAEAGPALTGDEPEAVEFILDQARAHPGQITLLAIGPLSNLADAYRRDPAAFGRLRRIVLMGGSVRRGYRDLPWRPDTGPTPEYNIVQDIEAARMVFAAGVPLIVAPLDATMIVLDEVKRMQIFNRSTPITDALALTWMQWSVAAGRAAVLFDTVALAAALDPAVCTLEAMHLSVDDDGHTRMTDGPANAEVCVDCDETRFFRWLAPRLLGGEARGAAG